MNLKYIGTHTLTPLGEKINFGGLKCVLCRKVIIMVFPI